MPEKSSALIAGATGLVGSLCLEMLLDSEYYEKVITLTRRPIDRRHSRLVQSIVDFDNLKDIELPPASDIFCAVGTTIRRAGSQAAFLKVDFEYARILATRCAGAGTEQFLLVSSVGADARSANFYLRVKGELEKAVNALPFQATHIFRPSFLIGERTEKRAGESIGIPIFKALRLALIGKLRKYRAIPAATVAAAMIAAARRRGSRPHVYHYDEILALAGDP